MIIRILPAELRCNSAKAKLSVTKALLQEIVRRKVSKENEGEITGGSGIESTRNGRNYPGSIVKLKLDWLARS